MLSHFASLAYCVANMQDLTVNGTEVNLLPSSGVTQSNQKIVGQPSAGCESHQPCTSDYCLNGGTCIDLWTTRQCSCSSAYSGTRCESQVMAYFTATSLAVANVNSSTGDLVLTQIGFWLSPATPSGVVFYAVSLYSRRV
jgi:hypothetical protein